MSGIADYFEGHAPWAVEKAAYRDMLLEAGLEETWKWSQPCYVHAGGNVAIIAAMKESCGLSFFKGVLLDDPDGLLVAPGENSRSGRWFKATSVEEIVAAKDGLKRLIAQAMQNEAEGRTVDFAKDDLVYPDELIAALDADSAFNTAWYGLTPGRQRGYVLHFAGARKAETREARIEKYRERILNGLGMHDRP
ncbi:YdeI family protein [Sagittula sp. P11]|uniref:YdeI/OmpD-associated family protein n=1 Tax=Sagittula sp. P11 TaxID=2009329 RepID=UPI0018E25390|nr:YdeI/OmpD-associated family protein [Sagittula sp. P11]